jgi:hypothetical protein
MYEKDAEEDKALSMFVLYVRRLISPARGVWLLTPYSGNNMLAA